MDAAFSILVGKRTMDALEKYSKGERIPLSEEGGVSRLGRREAHDFLLVVSRPLLKIELWKLFPNAGVISAIYEMASGKPYEMFRIASYLAHVRPCGMVTPFEFIELLEKRGWINREVLGWLDQIAERLYPDGAELVSSLLRHMLGDVSPMGFRA